MSEFRIDLDAVKESLNGHSIFAPSSSAMWLRCSGSLIANLLASDDAGEDAAYGTVGHSVAEEWLRDNAKPSHRLGEVVTVKEGKSSFDILIDNAMMDHVERYVLWCAPLPGTHYVEQRVYFSQVTPLEDQGGTADHVVCRWQHMCITDLKMGIGDKVYAQNNSQGMLYALGFFYEWDWFYDFQTITIRIAQPRIGNFDEWTITRQQLLDFAEHVKVRSALAWTDNAPLSPSPKACRWCRVSSTCTARLMQLLALARGDLSVLEATMSVEDMQEMKDSLQSGEFNMELADVKSMTTEDLAKLYPFIDTAKAWWEKVNAELYKRAMAGQDTITSKLVDGRGGRRKWRKEAVARRVLKNLGLRDGDVTELKSPAQIEEVLRSHGYKRAALPHLLDGLYYQDAPGLRLVPVEDKAPTAGPTSVYEHAFDDLNAPKPE